MEQQQTVRRYFDNSATSHPKPPGVLAAVQDYFENVHASAGRGAYEEARTSERILESCRAAVHNLFNCKPRDHVIFTLNGTDALNMVIKGVVRPNDHVVTTCMDHNSVLRPLSALEQQRGIRWTALPVDPHTTRLDPRQLAEAIRPETRLVAVNHASNVTGVLQPIDDVARICRERGVPCLIDAAQSAGHVPIDFGSLPVDYLALPGHKGLMGPLGTGVLVVRDGAAQFMETTREGGTGSVSESATQPDDLPDRFEAGSHNAVGLAGLLASVEWILDQTVAALRTHELALCGRLIERLNAIDGLAWFGPRDVQHRVGVFSVRLDGLEPPELSVILEREFGILSRSGLHCAPLAHRTIDTLERGGTTRLSLGAFTTAADVDAVADALADIARRSDADLSATLAANAASR